MFRVLWHIMLHGSVKGQIPKSTGNKAILTPKRALILPETLIMKTKNYFESVLFKLLNSMIDSMLLKFVRGKYLKKRKKLFLTQNKSFPKISILKPT